MKRNQNLIELSRDHHQGLLLGWKIKQGFKYQVPLDEIKKYIVYFAKEALFPHFEEEEKQVLIHLEATNKFYQRTLSEHRKIRELIAEIQAKESSTEALFLNLADHIHDHIRFEERELFPYLETTLSDEQLDEIGKLISNVHQPYIENYPHDFWTHQFEH
jgi:hemerythrin-like domain-containing protein